MNALLATYPHVVNLFRRFGLSATLGGGTGWPSDGPRPGPGPGSPPPPPFPPGPGGPADDPSGRPPPPPFPPPGPPGPGGPTDDHSGGPHGPGGPADDLSGGPEGSIFDTFPPVWLTPDSNYGPVRVRYRNTHTVPHFPMDATDTDGNFHQFDGLTPPAHLPTQPQPGGASAITL